MLKIEALASQKNQKQNYLAVTLTNGIKQLARDLAIPLLLVAAIKISNYYYRQHFWRLKTAVKKKKVDIKL